MGLTTTDILVWINGNGPDEGTWIPLDRVPAVLHHLEATFDVWIDDDTDPKYGAYAEQWESRT